MRTAWRICLNNRPAHTCPTTADAVYDDMKGRIDAILDAGTCDIGVESTVVECGDDEVTILRPGGITEQMLLEVVSKVNYDTALSSPTAVPKAPGMKYKHYAPKADMMILEGAYTDVKQEIERLRREKEREQRGGRQTAPCAGQHARTADQ